MSGGNRRRLRETTTGQTVVVRTRKVEMSMSNWNVSAPGKGGGGFSKEDHVNHRLVFVRPEREETTAYSGEGTQIAARCAYVCCLNCGLVLEDAPMYGAALVPALLDQGDIVAGTLALGAARPGRTAPYVLTEPTASELTAVEEFLDGRAVRMPSGKIMIEAATSGLPIEDIY